MRHGKRFPKKRIREKRWKLPAAGELTRENVLQHILDFKKLLDSLPREDPQPIVLPAWLVELLK